MIIIIFDARARVDLITEEVKLFFNSVVLVLNDTQFFLSLINSKLRPLEVTNIIEKSDSNFDSNKFGGRFCNNLDFNVKITLRCFD